MSNFEQTSKQNQQKQSQQQNLSFGSDLNTTLSLSRFPGDSSLSKGANSAQMGSGKIDRFQKSQRAKKKKTKFKTGPNESQQIEQQEQELSQILSATQTQHVEPTVPPSKQKTSVSTAGQKVIEPDYIQFELKTQRIQEVWDERNEMAYQHALKTCYSDKLHQRITKLFTSQRCLYLIACAQQIMMSDYHEYSSEDQSLQVIKNLKLELPLDDILLASILGSFNISGQRCTLQYPNQIASALVTKAFEDWQIADRTFSDSHLKIDDQKKQEAQTERNRQQSQMVETLRQDVGQSGTSVRPAEDVSFEAAGQRQIDTTSRNERPILTSNVVDEERKFTFTDYRLETMEIDEKQALTFKNWHTLYINKCEEHEILKYACEVYDVLSKRLAQDGFTPKIGSLSINYISSAVLQKYVDTPTGDSMLKNIETVGNEELNVCSRIILKQMKRTVAELSKLSRFQQSSHIDLSVIPVIHEIVRFFNDNNGLLASKQDFKTQRFVSRGFGNACQIVKIDNDFCATMPLCLPDIDIKHAYLFRYCKSFKINREVESLIKDTKKMIKIADFRKDLKY